MTRLLPLLLAALCCGCPAKPGPAKTSKTAPAPAPDAKQRERATAAAQALGKQLKARLKQALQEGGPAGGIKACKLAAPEIAGEVGAAQKLRVGRTSFKLRNPQNAPPAWAKAWVEARTAEPRFETATDGTLHALLPITLEPLCVTCHGDPSNLSKDVKAALAAEYPNDQATGFAPGELRGWFWVEVPPGT